MTGGAALLAEDGGAPGRAARRWRRELAARLPGPARRWRSPPASAGTSASSRPPGWSRWSPRSRRWRWWAGWRSPRSRTSSRPRTSCCSPATPSGRSRGSRSAPSRRSSRTCSCRRGRGRPWQMVGWGAVGIGGAGLALLLRGREPGRLTLALVCGLAGFAFGAWMDLYQLTLAAHQDLDSYLALVGHVAALQPRSRDRERGVLPLDRTGLHPRPAPLPQPPGGALARARGRRRDARPRAAALLPAAAGAASPADRAERWLLGVQNTDGGFGAAPGAGVQPPLQRLGRARAGGGRAQPARRPPQGRALAGRLRRARRRSVKDIGEVERTVLLLSAAGLSPRDFAGRDLVASRARAPPRERLDRRLRELHRLRRAGAALGGRLAGRRRR